MNSAENVSVTGAGIDIAAHALENGTDLGLAWEELCTIAELVLRTQALRSPPTEDADRVEAVARAFRNADGLDWNWLNNQIGDSGHGKFWKAIMAEVRAALSKDTPDV